MKEKEPCREGRFYSDCIDVFIDEPGDHTVRPIPPERIEQARAPARSDTGGGGGPEAAAARWAAILKRLYRAISYLR